MLCSLLRAFKVFFVGNAYYSSTATVHSDKNLSTVAITYTLQHSTLHIDNSITIINDYQYRHCFPQKHTDRYVYLSHDLHQKLKKIDRIPSFYHLSDSQLYKKQYKRTRVDPTTQNRSTYTVPPRPSDKHNYFSTPPSTHPSKPTPTSHHSNQHHSDTVVHSTPHIAIRPITRLNDVEYKTITQTSNLSEFSKKNVTNHSPHLEEESKTFNLTSNRQPTPHSTVQPTSHSHHNDSKKKDQLNITTNSTSHSGQSSNHSSPLSLQGQHTDTNNTLHSTTTIYVDKNTSSSNVSNKGSNRHTRHTIVVFTPSRRFVQPVHSHSISNTTSISSNSHRILPVNQSTSHKIIPHSSKSDKEHNHYSHNEQEQKQEHKNEHEHDSDHEHEHDLDHEHKHRHHHHSDSESDRDD